MEKNELIEKVKEILLKRAEGYYYNEVVEEFSANNQLSMLDNISSDPDPPSMIMTKRKVTTHHVPPDTTAIKLLLDLATESTDLTQLSEEELEKMRDELIKKLQDKEKL